MPEYIPVWVATKLRIRKHKVIIKTRGYVINDLGERVCYASCPNEAFTNKVDDMVKEGEWFLTEEEAVAAAKKVTTEPLIVEEMMDLEGVWKGRWAYINGN